MTRLVSRLYDDGPSDPPQGEEARRRNREAYAKAWHQRGLVIIDPADVLDDWTRQAIQSEAIRQYGKRKGQ